MKWKLATLLFSMLLVNPAVTPVADACGVKLTVKSGSPRRAVTRSSNPSDVLLLGKPPRRLERDLTEAGHHVDVARTPNEAKNKRYAVVVADNDQQAEAQARFPNSKILVRSSDAGADVRTVENEVRRTAIATSGTGTAIAAKEKRVPIATGSDNSIRKPIASSDTNGGAEASGAGAVRVAAAEPKVEAKVEAKVEPKVETPKTEPKVATVEPKTAPKVEAKAKVEPKIEAKVEPKVEAKVEPKTEPTAEPAVDKPAPKAKAVPSFANGELYFAIGVDSLNAHHASLDKAAKWLAANPDLGVVIEGHADPTGNSDANMTLSEKRAEWVKDQLVSRGIDASRLEVKGFGDTQLKYGRSDGRNRRVAIVPKP